VRVLALCSRRNNGQPFRNWIREGLPTMHLEYALWAAHNAIGLLTLGRIDRHEAVRLLRITLTGISG
jgi:hypothetical protein